MAKVTRGMCPNAFGSERGFASQAEAGSDGGRGEGAAEDTGHMGVHVPLDGPAPGESRSWNAAEASDLVVEYLQTNYQDKARCKIIKFN